MWTPEQLSELDQSVRRMLLEHIPWPVERLSLWMKLKDKDYIDIDHKLAERWPPDKLDVLVLLVGGL